MIHEYPKDVLHRSFVEREFADNENAFLNRLQEGAVLLVDKPKDWTSFDVVNKIKRSFGIKRVGHAGTLDPMATGLLIVCTAIKTKSIDSFVGLDKSYSGELKLGESTPSYDAETDVIVQKPFDHLSDEQIYKTAESLRGEIEQVPPMYSALKKDGKPLYKLARKGVDVKRDPRRVTVFEFDITKIELPFVWFKIRCSKGTYIRSIAHDVGERLETGAHLTGLRRTAIGSYTVDDAISIEVLNNIKDRLKRKHV